MDDGETARREALRKKGQEFLEKAVKQASSRGTRIGGDVRLHVAAPSEPIDPALETVGVMVEGLRLYLAALIFVVSSGASLVLAKVRAWPGRAGRRGGRLALKMERLLRRFVQALGVRANRALQMTCIDLRRVM